MAFTGLAWGDDAYPPLFVDIDEGASQGKAEPHAEEYWVAHRRTVGMDWRPLSSSDTRRALKLRLNLFDNRSFDVELDRFVRRSATSYTAFGHIAGGHETGAVLLTVEGSALVVEVRTDGGELFEVQGLGDDVYEVRELDPSYMPICGSVTHSQWTPSAAIEEKALAKQDDGQVIDVLFVFTPTVVSLHGDADQVRARIQAAVDGGNDALQNSAINTRFRAVGMEEINYTETEVGEIELNRITNPFDAFADFVHVLRNDFGADLVCAIINWTGNNFAGHAWILPSLNTANQNLGFGVVRSDSISQFIVNHEIGHNLGCDHDRNNASGNRLFPYSFGHRFNSSRTLMAYAPGIWTTRFSNPNINVGGTPTGIPDGQANSADNARTVNQSRTTVALFRLATIPSVSIATDRATAESDSGIAPMNFVATLSFAVNRTVTVNFATQNGTAIAGSDYNAASGTLIFPPNATAQLIPVQVLGDTSPEADETLTVSLSNANGAVIVDGVRTGTILNDDLPTLSVIPTALDEGDVGTVNATLFVTISGIGPAEVRVNFATVAQTAVDGVDYMGASGTLVWPSNTGGPRTITVPIIGNVVDDGIKYFRVQLSNVVNGAIGLGDVLIPIIDNEGPDLNIDDVTVTEGDTGAVAAVFTVSLSAPSPDAIFVDFRTSDNTASEFFFDYAPNSGRLSWPNNTATPQTVTVGVLGDLVGEIDETFSVFLSNALSATIVDAQGVGTILDDDGAQTSVSIADVTMVEGDSGTTHFAFDVTLSQVTPAEVMVDYYATDGTAVDFEDYDQADTFGTVTFPASSTTPQQILVPVYGDTAPEPDESFTITIHEPANVVITDGTAVGTILNDDGPLPNVSIADAMVVEAGGDAVLSVTLSMATPHVVTVNYSIAGDTATPGADYDDTTVAGQLTFPANILLPQQVTVPILDDLLPEGDETFTVTLSMPVNALIADGLGVGTILNDDGPPPMLSISDVSVTEGAIGTTVDAVFSVSLSAAVPATVTVDYNAMDGTATNGVDYDGANAFGTVTFPANTTTPQTIAVTVYGDGMPEPAETFSVSLNTPVNAIIGDGTGVGTILNDDGTRPTLRIDDVSVTEGDAGTVDAVFSVSLSAASAQTVTVDYFTTGVSATDDVDFDQANTFGTVTFAPNTTTPQPITVPVFGDTDSEPNETFEVTINAPVNATISDDTGVGTIRDDDHPVPGDVDGNGDVNAVDVQLVVNAALELDIGGLDADIDNNGDVNAIDVQLVVNAALGIPILVGP